MPCFGAPRLLTAVLKRNEGGSGGAEIWKISRFLGLLMQRRSDVALFGKKVPFGAHKSRFSSNFRCKVAAFWPYLWLLKQFLVKSSGGLALWGSKRWILKQFFDAKQQRFGPLWAPEATFWAFGAVFGVEWNDSNLVAGGSFLGLLLAI